MAYKTMGEMICALRKEQGMTQKDLAQRLNITDKAVSKWERDVAYPDTATIPKLAEILGISVEELMTLKPVEVSGHKGAEFFVDICLRSIPLAMGIAVTVTAMLGELDVKHGLVMLGIGLACVGLHLLREKK